VFFVVAAAASAAATAGCTLLFLPLAAAAAQVSHFVLRLAHCQTEDQRRWFLAQECALFKQRLGALSGEEIASFTKVSTRAGPAALSVRGKMD
jgi:DNA primase large subunit